MNREQAMLKPMDKEHPWICLSSYYYYTVDGKYSFFLSFLPQTYSKHNKVLESTPVLPLNVDEETYLGFGDSTRDFMGALHKGQGWSKSISCFI